MNTVSRQNAADSGALQCRNPGAAKLSKWRTLLAPGFPWQCVVLDPGMTMRWPVSNTIVIWHPHRCCMADTAHSGCVLRPPRCARAGRAPWATLVPMANCAAGVCAPPGCRPDRQHIGAECCDGAGGAAGRHVLRRIPFAVFESRVRRVAVMGFALVESVASGRMSVLAYPVGLRKDTGCASS
ncbi:hypothetical protein DQ04_15531010 [Trypanosoma grayi]|uniref:hypothetical protein n=1 Tax=Trypanosoma grayi TaxID=71804 RepID=UPI0004F4BD33|nr:hypothetical protein DQ04_15531010 [Trypanosoma grayi]KEG06169.1 hypothetical protein DQ04_15531010 [Trypanosoma grayi]